MTVFASIENLVADVPCTLQSASYLGWRALHIANGIIELFVVPAIGGRLIQLRLGNQELFYVNARHSGRVYQREENCCGAGWKNYGGHKVWPAPQGWSNATEWPGPPDPILDGGLYSCEVLEENPETVALQLESAHDEYTGLTLSRTIRIFRHSAEVRIQHVMRNTSKRPVRWALWQVTQQTANPSLSIFVPSRSYRQMFGEDPYENIQFDPEHGICRLNYTRQVAKFAMKPEQAWLATLDLSRGTALVETFPLFSSLPYPDDAALEFWINGPGKFTIGGKTIDTQKDSNGCDPFVETEVLSPLVTLKPGEEYSFVTSLMGTFTDARRIQAANSLAAIGCPLAAEAHDGFLQINSSFGILRSGTLEVALQAADSQFEQITSLGPVTPLKPCAIDHVIPYQERPSRVSLRLRDETGNLLGIVDSGIVA